jgi:hypothetical protein
MSNHVYSGAMGPFSAPFRAKVIITDGSIRPFFTQLATMQILQLCKTAHYDVMRPVD